MDWNKKIFDWLMLISLALLLLAPFFIFNDITGKAVLNKTKGEIKSDLYDFANELPITKLAGIGSQICVIVDVDNETSYTFSIDKNRDGITISEPFGWDCGGEYEEDLIIKYLSIADFYEHINEPTCERFKTTGAGEDFYYLPSRFVIRGGDPVCNNEFNKKYCAAVNYCLSKDEMTAGKLDCCLDIQLSELQKSIVANAKNGIFPTADELTRLEEEAVSQIKKPSAIGFGSLIWIGLIAIVLIMGSASLLMLKSKSKEKISLTDEHKKQLAEYVEKTKAQGFNEEQIKQTLLQQGWPEDSINEVIGAKNI